MIQEYGLKQKEAAKILRITSAAISQYKCNKRANEEIKDEFIINEIKISVKRIINEGNKVLEKEICKLRKMINKDNNYPI